MGLFLRFKWATVKKHISLDRLKDSDKLRITHTIANAGIEPIRVAAQNGNNPGMNEFLGRYLFQEEGECFGIIVMDFPGCDLVDQILKRNKHNRLRNPISYADQNAMDSADGADFNYTRTADGADLNNEITAEGVDFNAADTAEEFDFTLISDFEPPSPEDSDDDSSDDEYRDH
ncbi:hypothetical protein CFIMG_007565RA00001 [Ceratocystis fimbriata CBS 114723]|uniref:Uncharacterized protein n=1 Tax=Ceratocystis fimbriata CBS 114723 TaxID=1035309 RepID=A0A2C5WUU6_9PEZI|nr:hypothetical protein CFIMG_007565RA00001 [Ceratocystis fimbriata CBS 114723]